MGIKKIVIANLLPIIPISIGITFAVIEHQNKLAGQNLEVDNNQLLNKEVAYNDLQDFAQDGQGLRNFLADDYEQLAEDLQDNVEYNGWVSHLDNSYLEDIDKAIFEISNLEMTFKAKAFLLLNYLEKISIYQTNNFIQNEELEPGNDASAMLKSSYYDINGNYLYTKTQLDDGSFDYSQAKDASDYLIRRHGVNKTVEDYGVFKDDVTHIYMDNQKVLDMASESYQKDLEAALSRNNLALRSKVGYSNYNRIQVLLKEDREYDLLNSQDKYLLDAYQDNFYDFLEEVNNISAQYQFDNQTNDLYSRKVKLGIKVSFIYNLSKTILQKGHPNTFEDFANILLETTLKVGVGFGITKATETFFADLGATLGVEFGPAGMIIGGVVGKFVGTVVGLVLNYALGIKPTGNGFTIWENFNDHGLNDWKFQMSNNSKNMTLNAINWSDTYQHGVLWRVTDGWFYTPRLDIATQGDGRLTNISGTAVGGNDFNYGHKIQVHYK